MKMRFNEKFFYPAFFFLLIFCGVFWTPANSKTRWSSLHLLPDADFLSSGQFVIDAEGYAFADSAKNYVLRPTGLLNFGIMEWVNLDMGYAGGFTMGFKARLLGENGDYIPSLAIGVRNIVRSRESNYFNSKDTLTNEFYFALAKSIDPIRLRIHAGMQTIPTSDKDQVDPFVALEEYFGFGLYATLEVERLKSAFWPSLFASWRFLEKKIEISAGAVAVNRLFFDKNNKFNVSLKSTDASGFVKPGIWLGVRYRGFIPLAKTQVFSSLDDNVKTQGEYIDQLKKQVDSLKTTLSENLTRLAKVDNSLLMLSDSISSDKTRLKAALLERLVSLKVLYESEPFEPEQVKQTIYRIVATKGTTLPIIKELVLDKSQDRKIRMLCISLIGEIGGGGASDALLDVLSQSEDPDVKIEILIALGKIKETRALYVMEQLANDPIDVVAFTAQEVLQKLVREKGIQLSSDFKMRPIAMPDTTMIREEKIPAQRTDKIKEGRGKDTLSRIAEKAPSSTGKIQSALNAIAPDAAKATKGHMPDAARQKAHDSLKTKPAQGGGTNPPDVWGLQTSGKDSVSAAPMKKEQVPALPSDTTHGAADTLSGKRSAQLVIGANKADSSSQKSTKKAKKDEKAQTKRDGKKAKDPKKKSTSASDDKNW